MSLNKKTPITNSRNNSTAKSEVIKDAKRLRSNEKLGTSPELWPEQIPGISDFIAMSNTPIHTSPSEWCKGLTPEDRLEISQLNLKSPNTLVMEIKKIYDEAYQLGVNEAREMTRGKYLGIFTNNKKNKQAKN